MADAEEKQIPNANEEVKEEKKDGDGDAAAEEEDSDNEYEILYDKAGKQMYPKITDPAKIEKLWEDYRAMTDEQREKEGPPRN